MVAPRRGERDLQFDAFISYRQVDPDRTIAEALHRRLERYRLPRPLVRAGFPRRLNRVFRDRDELAASSDLRADIRESLRGSRFLVVVCSPRTPESRWINEEVSIFLGLGRHSRILCVLVEGELDESLPAPLKEGETVPLAIDARASSIGHAIRRLRKESLRLTAAIVGCRYDDLKRRESVRKRWRGAGLVLGIAVLLAGSGLAGTAIYRERISNTILGLSQRAVAQAEEGNFEDSVRSALAAWRTSEENNGLHWAPVDHAMRSILATSHPRKRIEVDATASTVAVHWSGRMAIASDNGAVTTQTLDALSPRRLFDEGPYVTALAFGERGELVAVGRLDGSVKVRRFRTGDVIFSHGPQEEDGVTAIALHGERGLLAIGGTALRIFHLDDRGSPLTKIEGQGGIQALSFGGNGHVLASVSMDKTVRIFDWQSGTPRQTILGSHDSYARDVAVDAQERFVVSTGDDGVVIVWDLGTTDQPHARKLTVKDRLRAIALDRDGRRLAAGGYNQKIYIWDLASQEQAPLTMDGHRYAIGSLALAANSHLFSWDGEDDPLLWHLDSPAMIRVHKVQTKFRIDKMLFEPGGGSLIWSAGMEAYRSRLTPYGFQMESIGRRKSLISAISLAEAGRTLAIGRVDGVMEIWGLAPLELVRTVRLEIDKIARIQLEPGGDSGVAWSDDGLRQRWPEGAPEQIVKEKQDLRLLTMSHNSRQFFAKDHQGRIVQWVGATESVPSILAEKLHANQRTHCAAVTADSQWLAIGGLRPSVLLFDLNSRRRSFVQLDIDSEVFSLAFDSTGSLLAIGGRDRQIEIRRSGRLEAAPVVLAPTALGPHDWLGHSNIQGLQRPLAFSPDGALLAAGFGGSSIAVWPTTTTLVAELESLVKPSH